MTKTPIAAAVAGALISGAAMYTVGAKTATVDAFAQSPALVQTTDGQYVPATPLASPARTQLVSSPAVRTVATRRTVTRPAPAATRVVRDTRDTAVRDEAPAGRTWKKSAMIIGGSAASGAGVGAIVKGKKGALIGAALGGGAATIYEASKH